MKSFKQLEQQIAQCGLCTAYLPFAPQPSYQAHTSSRLLIVGQAPSLTVHETGILWNDASGKRLVDWLGITTDMLHDKTKVSILPMGFCYPGRGKNGDLPPRKECAPLWHEKLLAYLKPKLTLLVGQYAQAYYLQDQRKPNLTETVRSFRDYLPHFIPLPHPSPLNNTWLSKNPWFTAEVVPQVRVLIKNKLCASP